MGLSCAPFLHVFPQLKKDLPLVQKLVARNDQSSLMFQLGLFPFSNDPAKQLPILRLDT